MPADTIKTVATHATSTRIACASLIERLERDLAAGRIAKTRFAALSRQLRMMDRCAAGTLAQLPSSAR